MNERMRATVLGCLILLGCGGGAAEGGEQHIAPAGGDDAYPIVTTETNPPAALAAPADQALMVFLCPAECPPTAIVDGSGAIVAEIAHRTRAVATVAPGQVTFYALAAGNGDRVSGEVRAGGTYFVTLSQHPTGGTDFMTLAPSTPGERWAHVSEFIADTTEHEIDPAQRGTLDARVIDAELHTRMSALDTRAGEMDEAHRAVRTIVADDGFAQRQ